MQRAEYECICFADSAMIVHVVPESAEVSSYHAASGIYRALHTMYMAARG